MHRILRPTAIRRFYRSFGCVFLVTGVLLVWWFMSSNPVQLLLKRFQFCEDFPMINISMSPIYNRMKPEFEETVKQVLEGKMAEGHSAQSPLQYKAMHFLAGQDTVKTVCETGFNLGHSSFNYLTANDEAIVHSFDLGKHRYAHKMSKYLTEKFPNRFFIHFGDSTKTVPEFIRSNPGFQCDMMFIDGGHLYPVALADLTNFAMIANLEDNIIILDDYPTNWGAVFGRAWEELAKEGTIAEYGRCTFRTVDENGLQHGLTVGRVYKRPGS